MKNVLFITNGHGEDMVAQNIIKALPLDKINVDVLPVVGKGEQYSDLPVKLIGPRIVLPSGGFGLRNYSCLIKDLFSGLIGKTAVQISTLRDRRFNYSLVIAIGDVVPIVYSILTQCPFILVGVNKSAYYKKLAFNYTSLEKWLLRKYCRLTFARDEKTAVSFQKDGIKTMYLGNPLMDGVKGISTEVERSAHFRVRKGKTIGFLPGTRDDAYKNIEDFYKIASLIKQSDKKIKFVLSFPSNLDKKRFSKIKPLIKMKLSNDFLKVLKSSGLIIGLSGTGNEQAAGCGIPVIAFPGRGAQFNSRFAAGQKELLGKALLLLPRDSKLIAKASLRLLRNRKRIRLMGKEGIKRMGKPGASRKIGKIVEKELRF